MLLTQGLSQASELGEECFSRIVQRGRCHRPTPLKFRRRLLLCLFCFAATALVTSPRSAAAVLRSAAGCAAVSFCFSAVAGCFLLPFRASATMGGLWFCAVAAASFPPPRRCLFSAAVSLCPSPLPLFRRRRLLVPVPLVAVCWFAMTEEMGPKNDVVLDAGSASKTENVPIQVTSIRLTKDNYLSWSAALEIGITSRGRLSYITGDKPAPNKSDLQWATWALEDSQTVLAKMYGRKKRHLRTYQIKRSIYSLKQGDLSVAVFYAALKTKWEELDYHVNDEWNCGSNHSLYWEKEWMDRTFLFLGGLRDEFESIRSQILNGDEIPGIEEVYACVESEEQRRQVMHLDTGHGPSAFVSRASGTGQRPARRCTHCNKLGHSVDFCWDIHPEKRLVRGRPPSGRRSPSVSDSSQSNPSSGAKSKLSPDQLKELQAYISRLSTTPEEASTWRRAFFVDRSSWKLPSLNAIEVPASVFRLQPIRAAVLLPCVLLPRDPHRCLGIRVCRSLGIRAAASGSAPSPRVPHCRLGICAIVFSVYGCLAPPLWKSSAPSCSAVAVVFLRLPPRSPLPPSPLLPVSLSCFPEKKGDMRA
ncbi:hypothetical protein EJ110_NYTH54489 [Nymphaea thermarum]|nr:hypothetical protein EJ110_NYTH54489 [Nymphaea thermarum]